MVRYQTVSDGSQTYCLLPYKDANVLGGTEPVLAVPYFERVEEALSQALAYAAQVAPQFTDSGFERISGIGALAGRDRYDVQLSAPSVFFRGQANTRYTPLPTAVRLEGVDDVEAEVRRRLAAEAAHMQRLLVEKRAHGAETWDELQLRAAARHYGAPSRLLDFSFDPRVAAAFAHPEFSETERVKGAPFGMLYALDLQILNDTFGLISGGSTVSGGYEIQLHNLYSELQVPFLGWDAGRRRLGPMALRLTAPESLRELCGTVRTTSVPGLRRIKAQSGLFVEFDTDLADDVFAQLWFWTLLDLASHKWCFRRRDEALAVLDADGQPLDLFAD